MRLGMQQLCGCHSADLANALPYKMSECMCMCGCVFVGVDVG